MLWSKNWSIDLASWWSVLAVYLVCVWLCKFWWPKKLTCAAQWAYLLLEYKLESSARQDTLKSLHHYSSHFCADALERTKSSGSQGSRESSPTSPRQKPGAHARPNLVEEFFKDMKALHLRWRHTLQEAGSLASDSFNAFYKLLKTKVGRPPQPMMTDEEIEVIKR